jgi:hypothetical protein
LKGPGKTGRFNQDEKRGRLRFLLTAPAHEIGCLRCFPVQIATVPEGIDMHYMVFKSQGGRFAVAHWGLADDQQDAMECLNLKDCDRFM